MSDNSGGGVGNSGAAPGGAGVVLAELYEDAFQFAEQAVECEAVGNADGVRCYLSEAVEAFLHVLDVEEDESRRSLVSHHVGEYLAKIEHLQRSLHRQGHSTAPVAAAAQKHKVQQDVARFAFEQALAEDERQAGRQASSSGSSRTDEEIEDLIALYMEAADQFLRALRSDASDGATKEKLTRRLEAVIGRAEALKSLKSDAPPGPRRPAAAAQTAGGDLSKREKEILVACSRVNGKLFVPFLDDDKRERFVGSVFGDGFVDPDGLLSLAEKQKKHFRSWRRPGELRNYNNGREPRVVDLISHYSITQTVVSDCSFVASLSVCAVYERMFRQQVITHIIYPQNRKGMPVLSHSGKYLVRLRFNGIDRKVIVDDKLPCSNSGDLLCSYSSNAGELWVSLIEKAYMKLHGGYSFPGSNSGTDLHALVGWIPERASLDEVPDRSKQWQRMYDGWKLGQCLLTVSTKNGMSEEVAAERGLVPGHAYAVLKLAQVDGVRLLQLKNPWAKKRWKGPWGEGDTEHWTPRMQKALGYNVLKALQVDNGIFWIDFDSVCEYFPDAFLSWNPGMFPYRTSLHSKFERGLPVNDRFCFGDDPQFGVEVRPSDSSGASLWLLLNKHVNSTDEKQRDYVTLHVFDKAEGRRVYYTDGALVSGTYINSPFYLLKLSFGDGSVAAKEKKQPPKLYTVVVSQYERKYDISFTLSAFCTSYFRIIELPQQLRWNYRIESRWNTRNAKGCSNYAGYGDNPKFLLRFNARGRAGGKGSPSITPSSKTQLLIKLDAPDEFYVNLRVYATRAGREHEVLDRSLFWVGSGAYRRSFCYVEEHGVALLQRLPAAGGSGGRSVAADYAAGDDEYRFAEFLIVASTYEPGQLGAFAVTVGSSAANFTLTGL